jgi:hypothetical protein
MQAEPVRDPEAVPLAREMVNGLRELVSSYEGEEGLSTSEALARVREDQRDTDQGVLQCAPWQVHWSDLEGLQERDPTKFHQWWEEIKQAAREELRSGHRAAQLVEVSGSTPWDRARFLAVRQELTEGWHPRNGIEQQLVDQLAQAQTAREYWLEEVMSRGRREARSEQRWEQRWEAERERIYQEPRAAPLPAGFLAVRQAKPTGFEGVEQAGAMVERFHRMFLRTLRALQDLRKGPQPVFVQNAGQVNVGQQQVNMTHLANGRKKAAKSSVPDVIGQRTAAPLPNGQAGHGTPFGDGPVVE